MDPPGHIPVPYEHRTKPDAVGATREAFEEIGKLVQMELSCLCFFCFVPPRLFSTDKGLTY
jgi:hypothetical protein